MIVILMFLPTKVSAAPSKFPGYRPTASATDFRNVQHNPGLEQYLRNINNINESISTIQADHIPIKTFVHPINVTLEEVYNGLDEACYLINTFKDVCSHVEDSCQHVNEFVKVNERAVRGFIHVLSSFERVCTMEDCPSSEIAIARCK